MVTSPHVTGPSARRRFHGEIPKMLLLAVASALIWVAHTHKWTGSEWQVPSSYNGDTLEIIARIQIGAEGANVPLQSQTIDRLGAPLGADWNAYPTPEKLILLALGGIAAFSNVFVAANVGMLLGQIANALAFYWVVRRWLWVRWEWAMAGALLFACNSATFHRGLAHYSIFLIWVIPLGLLACWLVARSRRLTWREPGAIACLVAGAALGCHNTYYLYFWLPLMAWALLAQWHGPRRRSNLEIGLATLGAGLLVFLVMNFEHWFHGAGADSVPLLVRNYGGTEHYALKPIEMLIPPADHNWDALAFFGERYTRWSEWRGEAQLPYLGLVGIAGLLGLTTVAVRRLLMRRPPPGESLLVAWLIAFGCVGGLTNVLSFFGGLYSFRATNRIGIFIAAIVLVFLVVRLSRLTARWRRPWPLIAALGLTILGVADQLPRPESPSTRQSRAALLEADRAYGRQLEATLPPGSTIFQLPVMGFPEVVPPGKLTDYELFRPFLHTQTLRFSYGMIKNNPRGRWQEDLPSEPGRLVQELESLGFAGLYINRKGFSDQGASLLADLQTLGYTRQIADQTGDQVVVILRPSATPRLPLAQSLTQNSGWHHQIRDGVRWAYDPTALLLYDNPYSHRLTVNLTLNLQSSEPLKFYQQDKLLAEFSGGKENRSCHVRAVQLQPGLNTFELRSTLTPQRASAGYLKTFGLAGSKVEPNAIEQAPPANLSQ